MIFSSLSVILILSTYFLIAYFLAIRTFETAANVIDTLKIIFYKGSCFDSALNFLRENQIRNETQFIIPIDSINSEDKVSATDFYLDYCMKKEVDYNKMRTSLPANFQGAQAYFDALESSELCDFVYGNKSQSADKKLLRTC